MTEHANDSGTHHHEQHDGGGTYVGGLRPGGLPLDENARDAAVMWDGMYRERPKVWSGNPNPQLVAETAGLAPGNALDLGCGEGGDAIWLAGQGWSVTAVDVSAVALERAAAHAVEAGLAGRITWQQQDLAEWSPEPRFDLVSAQFLHSPLLSWRDSLASAAAAVAPGGTLLVVGHHPHGLPSWSHHHDADAFFTPEQLGEELRVEGGLRLREGPWRVDVLTSRERTMTGPDGESATILDTVLRATKHG